MRNDQTFRVIFNATTVAYHGPRLEDAGLVIADAILLDQVVRIEMEHIDYRTWTQRKGETFPKITRSKVFDRVTD